MKKIIIHVYGRVQGVFFRYTTRKLARKLGLTGFVKNMPDSSVYIEAEGNDKAIEELLKFAHKGPEMAVIEDIKYEYSEPDNKYKGFDYKF